MKTRLSLALLQCPSVANAQDRNFENEVKFLIRGLDCQGPEGSWLYTVTIPGYTFQGVETYTLGGGYT